MEVEVYEIAEGVDGDDGARNNVASVHSAAEYFYPWQPLTVATNLRSQ